MSALPGAWDDALVYVFGLLTTLLYGIEFSPETRPTVGIWFKRFVATAAVVAGAAAAIALDSFGNCLAGAGHFGFGIGFDAGHVGGALWAVSNVLVLPTLAHTHGFSGLLPAHALNCAVGFCIGRFGICPSAAAVNGHASEASRRDLRHAGVGLLLVSLALSLCVYPALRGAPRDGGESSSDDELVETDTSKEHGAPLLPRAAQACGRRCGPASGAASYRRLVTRVKGVGLQFAVVAGALGAVDALTRSAVEGRVVRYFMAQAVGAFFVATAGLVALTLIALTARLDVEAPEALPILGAGLLWAGAFAAAAAVLDGAPPAALDAAGPALLTVAAAWACGDVSGAWNTSLFLTALAAQAGGVAFLGLGRD